MKSISFNKYEFWYDDMLFPIKDVDKQMICFFSEDFKCLNIMIQLNKNNNLEINLYEETEFLSLSETKKQINLI